MSLPAPAQAAGPAYQVASNWGGLGIANGKFEGVGGIAVAPNGQVFVADGENNRIQVFNPTGTFLRKWSTFAPTAITVDDTGDVYALSAELRQFSKYSPTGTLLASKTFAAGVYPLSIAVAPGGELYISTIELATLGINVKLEKRSNDAADLIGTVANDFPFGLAVDGSGNLYVSNPIGSRIYKYNPSGALVQTWGSEGSSWGKFSFPGPIAVDGSGNVYVADIDNHRVQRFNSSGATQAVFGSSGTGLGRFSGITGMDVSDGGIVYVSDIDSPDFSEAEDEEAAEHEVTYERVQRFVPMATGSSINMWSTTGTWAYGSSASVKLSGTVRNALQRGIPGVPVFIQKRKADGTWGWKATVYTDWNGVYRWAFKPGANGTWRAHFGANTFATSDSATKAIQVAPKVSLWFNSRHVYYRQTLTTNGLVAPGHAGKTVYLQLWNESTRKWEWAATGRLNSSSKWSFGDRVDFRDRASVVFRLKFPGESDHAPAYSGMRRIYFN